MLLVLNCYETLTPVDEWPAAKACRGWDGMFDTMSQDRAVWSVGALCRAIADTLQARFNPVRVSGEISGFSRAASGHCYFSLKDDAGQLRCAMFRRAAMALDFSPQDGERVEVEARLSVYEPRGDLQLVVEDMRRAGQGHLFEQFLKLKARLEVQGLFDAARKRTLPRMPRAIGLVTSNGAAALNDVVTALERRVPHIPVLLAPASVQGLQAPAELVRALQALYARTGTGADGTPPVDVILLVRGGGSIEDLWAFNDEQLVHTIAQSPVPVVCGVGHETDFTLADFVADLRASTPTAAAKRVVPDVNEELARVREGVSRIRLQTHQFVTTEWNKLEQLRSRPSLSDGEWIIGNRADELVRYVQRGSDLVTRMLENAQAETSALRGQLRALSPQSTLDRGYAIALLGNGKAVRSPADAPDGTTLTIALSGGRLGAVSSGETKK